ncbi:MULTISPECIES: hypothetical protein [unclassified Gordonia (in: high G+C Gram-positive bacteria)]|uniref:hypothetical protein n=1 Tax=unclassified Gordonia (in: high G+C Gram-positive bacteria) TaxID=2657482 RepID=UPI001965D4A4|nr:MULTISPECIES: hypothetical protein [unclassified Gordonia (in: high G+C Gram-positive bacteria)]MBN0974265.1 hypothetical protein [Gordonia sp. BP-119]MBN0981915.1 hypothetical protein [Gordonia sp. BP-94]
MTNDAQVVVYRSCMSGGPQWQFYSMPESIVGGAHDLEDARQQYRDALAFSLDVPDSQLPEIRELVEHETVKGTGIWVRGGLDAPTYDNALKFLTRYVESQPSDEVEWFFEQPAASGDVIIVPVEFDDTLRIITSQMTPFDSVWVVAQGKDPDGHDMLAWLAIGGSDAAPAADDGVNLADLGLTPDSPMVDVFHRVIENSERQHSRGKYALATV